MNIINPAYKSPTEKAIEKHTVAIVSEISKISKDIKLFSFDDLRALFTKAEQIEMSDGVLMQICQDNNIPVSE